MKKLLLSSVAVTILQLSGCALINLPDNSTWIKPGASDQDFARDKYQCKRESQQAYSSSSIGGSSWATPGMGMGQLNGDSSSGVRTNWTLYRECLQARGWRAQEETMSKPSAQPLSTSNITPIIPQSSNWNDKIIKKVRANITFNADNFKGTTQAVIQVKLSPDGTILSRTLTTSSGDKAWDQALLNAIDATKSFPKDDQGRLLTLTPEIKFSPKIPTIQPAANNARFICIPAGKGVGYKSKLDEDGTVWLVTEVVGLGDKDCSTAKYPLKVKSVFYAVN